MNDLRQQCQVLLEGINDSLDEGALYEARDSLLGILVFYAPIHTEITSIREFEAFWQDKLLRHAETEPVYRFENARITDYNRHARLTFDVGEYDVEQWQKYADERTTFSLTVTKAGGK